MKKLFSLTLIAFVLTSLLVSCPQGSEKNGTTGGNGITTTGGTNGSTQGGSSGGSGSGNTGGSSGSESGNSSEPSTPKTYIVTFEANGGEGMMEPQVFTENQPQALKKNTFTSGDLVFVGWSTNSDNPFGPKEYDDEEVITITKDTTLYAVWELYDPVFYIVTFDTNGGHISFGFGTQYTQQFLEGNPRPLQKNRFVRQGFHFVCWEDENGKRYQDQEVITVDRDFTLYAVWTCLGALPDYIGTAGPDWEYVTFGEWPQTVLPEDSSVIIDKTKRKVVGMFTYYKGSDEAWYVEQAENALFENDEYKYSDGTPVKKGSSTTRYFKVEPIKWRVLEEKNGKKFLVSEDALTALAYYDYYELREIDGTTIYPNNYMHSKVRAWLNGYNYPRDAGSGTVNCTDHQNNGFLQTAFITDVQKKIAITNVDNSVESTLYSSNQYVCDNTDDKVFLLSAKEATNETYGFKAANTIDDHLYETVKAQLRKTTDFALATGVEIIRRSFYDSAFNPMSPIIYSTWYLRSPQIDFGYMECDNVYTVHTVVDTSWRSSIVFPSSAVAPALWVEYEE